MIGKRQAAVLRAVRDARLPVKFGVFTASGLTATQFDTALAGVMEKRLVASFRTPVDATHYRLTDAGRAALAEWEAKQDGSR